MKVFVTGVAGQLGHDVMNELADRGYEGIGSDIRGVYSGLCDGTAAESMPYVQMDITDADSVGNVLRSVKPDVVFHCAAWTAVDLAENWAARWFISVQIMCLTGLEMNPGSRIVRTTVR